MKQRNFIVGDIQGCYKALRGLLKKISFDRENDTLWCVGDLVNRGGESYKVLEYLYNLKHKKIILGNHDIYLLLNWQNPQKHQPREKELYQVLEHNKADEWLGWLIKQPLLRVQWLNGKKYAVVHAGVPHIWGLEKSQDIAADISKFIQTKGVKHLWSDEPRVLQSEHTEVELFTYGLNSLTRMRHIGSSGKLDLKYNKPRHYSPHFRPWFEYKSKLSCDALFFGHWAAIKGKISKKGKTNTLKKGACNIYALDTGYVWGGQLTIMNMETREVFRYKSI